MYPLCEGSGPGAADTTLTLTTASIIVKRSSDRISSLLRREILRVTSRVSRPVHYPNSAVSSLREQMKRARWRDAVTFVIR
jgi:hypothetical protein